MGKSARYIGSSDAPMILGVPSYGRTALDVWERMVGLTRDEDRALSAEMRWGLLLEPLILADYATQREVKLDRRRARRRCTRCTGDRGGRTAGAGGRA